MGNAARDAVEANLQRNPLLVALDSSISNARLVASQVKYLQRARAKLPSYYEARCLIPPLAYEQSSGETAAEHKSSYGGGSLCIDLTCGLGVDSFFFSKVFEHVVSVERDAALALTASGNFRRLGARNIEIVQEDAESFMGRFAAASGRADLIYADPARRGRSGRKVAAIADCSPDVVELLPLLRQCARTVMVKLSPMFDVDEVFRIFGPAVTVDVISAGGECKEVLVVTGETVFEPLLRVSLPGKGTIEYRKENRAEAAEEKTENLPSPDLPMFGYMVAPDAALVKTRVAARYFRESGAYIDSNNSYAFFPAGDPPGDFIPGALYKIVSTEPYDPKSLRKRFKTDGVQRLNILCRNFPEDAPRIASWLGVKEGGTGYVAFTRLGGKPVMIILDPVTGRQG